MDPFAVPRQQAADSAAADAAATTFNDKEDTSVVTEIPAQPEATESTNPEQVLVEEPSDGADETPAVEEAPAVEA